MNRGRFLVKNAAVGRRDRLPRFVLRDLSGCAAPGYANSGRSRFGGGRGAFGAVISHRRRAGHAAGARGPPALGRATVAGKGSNYERDFR